jgi:hypothetical protein
MGAVSVVPASALLPVDGTADQVYYGWQRTTSRQEPQHAGQHSNDCNGGQHPQRTQPDGAQSSGTAQRGQRPAGSQRSAVRHGKEDVE